MASDQGQESTMTVQQDNELRTSTNNEAQAIPPFLEIVKEIIGNNNPVSERTALKFLRARKNDVNRAIDLYKAHEGLRRALGSININDEKLNAELDSQKFTILKCRDPNNSMIALFKAKLHQPDKSSKSPQLCEEIHRYTLQGIVYQLDAALDDEETQRNGIVFIYDMRESDFSTNFDLELCSKILNLLKGAYPARLKRILVVGSPFWFKFVFKFLSVIVKQKLRERVDLLSVNQLQKYLPPESLTPEFGGTHEHDHQAWLRECVILHRNITNDLYNPYFAQSPYMNTNNNSPTTTNDNNGNHVLSPIEQQQAITSHRQAQAQSTRNSQIVTTTTDASRTKSTTSNSKNQTSINRPTINLKDIVPQHADLLGINEGNSSMRTQAINYINKPQFYDYDDRDGMSLAQFIETVRMKGLGDLGNEYERDITANDKLGTFNASTLEENMPKNRYVNVKCYDHTRVILEPYDLVEPDISEILTLSSQLQPATDYINANWVDGYKQPKAYISTQGPTENTLNDFWRMIWQTSCRVIAMVTLNIENNVLKCDKYWPSPVANPIQMIKPTSSDKQRQIKAGVYTIDYIGVEHSEDYTITQLKLTNTRSQVSRDIWHMQFTSWPDFGTPRTATALLKYRQSVICKQMEAIKICGGGSTSATSTYPPIVVHCSAGVGRSGTFITIDICINKLDTTGLIDVKGVVEKLREQRFSSIQTMDQYVFCYKSVFEYALSIGLLEGEDLDDLFN